MEINVIRIRLIDDGWFMLVCIRLM